jgi:hypothetical protein
MKRRVCVSPQQPPDAKHSTSPKINRMNKPLFPASLRVLLMGALVCAAGMAQAQDKPPAAAPVLPPPAAAPDAAGQNLLDRKTQKVEHLSFEDKGNRVDEVRSGGQTQRITVQPKNGLPAYEVQPASPGSANPGAGIGQTGSRVWHIRQF